MFSVCIYQIHLIYVIHNDNKHDSFLLIKRYTSTKAHRLCSPLFIIILDVLSQLGSKPPESMLCVALHGHLLIKKEGRIPQRNGAGKESLEKVAR